MTGFDTLGTNTIQRYYNKTDTTGIDIDPSSLIRYGKNNFAMYARASPPGQSWNYIMKIRANGDTIASRLLLNSGNLDTMILLSTRGEMIYGMDGNFYISGRSSISKPQRNIQPYIVKVDTSLKLQWVLFLKMGENGLRIHQLPDGSLLTVGANYSPAYISLHKLSQDGELLDSAKVSTQIDTNCSTWYSMFHSEDSTISFAGALNGNAYLARIDLKKFVVTGIKDELLIQSSFIVSPNPSNGTLQIHSQQTGNLEIYDTKGLLIKKLRIESLEQQADISDLKAGAYLYRFLMEDGVKYGKIVKE